MATHFKVVHKIRHHAEGKSAVDLHPGAIVPAATFSAKDVAALTRHGAIAVHTPLPEETILALGEPEILSPEELAKLKVPGLVAYAFDKYGLELKAGQGKAAILEAIAEQAALAAASVPAAQGAEE